MKEGETITMRVWEVEGSEPEDQNFTIRVIQGDKPTKAVPAPTMQTEDTSSFEGRMTEVEHTEQVQPDPETLTIPVVDSEHTDQPTVQDADQPKPNPQRRTAPMTEVVKGE